MSEQKSAATILGRRPRVSDRVLKALIFLSAGITVLLLAGILIYILVRGFPNLSWEFLSTAPSTLKKRFGILPSIINTLYMIVITLVISTPIGVGAAIYLTEYAKQGRFIRLIEFTIETLAGIPSIIYGLFGAIFFGTLLQLGYSILSGAFTLTIMVLPLIIRTTEEALKTVPASYREGALGMGATKWYMIRTVILPSSLPGIITAVILSIGRIVGESAALLYTAGSVTNLPANWLTHPASSGATLTVQMYFAVSEGRYIEQGFGIALVLMVIVLLINGLTKVLAGRAGSKAKG
ncbi:phosphate ABC transporter permease PstA [Acetanaerobacterium elongatum]|uniref:Phosphate transport system permease protein PstA n=1 Tax=Acetanaerobacterium elongatum TaxID=258515 RepID=A0A1H0GXP2_9FIRM|nr:phosphate ABC transporter permease PstA [Acetanaerobacterium elongatum]SDO11657.1 phosphate ABC transporter membrane protein 2, PhoT family [Acetanaerobacterium elongatum]